MEWKGDIIAILSAFYIVTKQTVLLDTYYITNLVKWSCFHCTIAVSHAHQTLCYYCYNLILKVVFLFQSFLVIPVAAYSKIKNL